MNAKLKALIAVVCGPICGVVLTCVFGIGSTLMDCVGCACAIITCDCSYEPTSLDNFMASAGSVMKVCIICGLVLGIGLAVALLVQEKQEEEERRRIAERDAERERRRREEARRAAREREEQKQRERWRKEALDRAIAASEKCIEQKSKAMLYLTAGQRQEAASTMSKIETELLKSSELLGKLDVMCGDIRKEGEQIK